MSKTATDKPHGRIVHDPEVQAMAAIARVMGEAKAKDPDSVPRIVAWVNAKWGEKESPREMS